MNRDSSNRLPDVTCPQCQANNSPLRAKCWICFGSLTQPNPFANAADTVAIDGRDMSAVPTPTLDRKIRQRHAIRTVIYVVFGLSCLLLVLVGIGIGWDSPPAIMSLTFIVAPALVALLAQGLRDHTADEGTSRASYWLEIFSVLGMTFAIMGLMFIALIIALFVTCLSIFSFA